MMTDLHDVMPGTPVGRRQASQHNAFMEAARRADFVQKTQLPSPGVRKFPIQQNDQIWVRNQQAYAVSIENLYAIVGFGAPVFDAADGAQELNSFLFQPILEAVWPATTASQASWGIALSPMLPGAVREAVVSGSCVARVSSDCSVGDAVGISSNATYQDQDTLVPVSGGMATVVSMSGIIDDEELPYRWAVIRFGSSGSGPAMVEFQLEEVCCDTLTATATVTRILCSGGSGVELGDLIELIDSRQCHLIGANPEPSMWLGIKGVAIKMEFNISDYPAYSYVCDDLAPITGNNDCKWSILDLCNNGNFCA